ncbi:MAG: hypothetical protein NZ600_03490, partial [Acidimicrobiales bacterium]|nr:hypothetical protein [Acidimicrobiales bacterium]
MPEEGLGRLSAAGIQRLVVDLSHELVLERKHPTSSDPCRLGATVGSWTSKRYGLIWLRRTV